MPHGEIGIRARRDENTSPLLDIGFEVEGVAGGVIGYDKYLWFERRRENR